MLVKVPNFHSFPTLSATFNFTSPYIRCYCTAVHGMWTSCWCH